jgi:hypothetical protein
MKRTRYREWIAVFEWFQKIEMTEVVPKGDWKELYRLLDGMWRDEREKDATPEELAAHAAAMAMWEQ